MKTAKILLACFISIFCSSCSFFTSTSTKWYEEDFSEEQTMNIEQREIYTATIDQPNSNVLETWSASLMTKGSSFTKSFIAQSANGNTVGKSTWRFVSNFSVYWKFVDSNYNIIYEKIYGETELYIELSEGETYKIITTHAGTNGVYEFSAYAPNGIYVIPLNASSKHVQINDVYRYKRQVVTYEYTPNITGIFNFQTSIQSNWLIVDFNNNVTYQPDYAGKPESSISVNLVANMHYMIYLTQDSSTIGPVVFTMYRPSEIIDIGTLNYGDKLKINDYLYYLTETKSFQFNITYKLIEIISTKPVADWHLYDSYGNDHHTKGNYSYYGSNNNWRYNITFKNITINSQYKLVLPFSSSSSGLATIYLRCC